MKGSAFNVLKEVTTQPRLALVSKAAARAIACSGAAVLSALRFYMPGAQNPADRPSRRSGLSTRAPAPAAPGWAVIHLFSGHRGAGDLEDQLKWLASANGIHLPVLSLDSCLTPMHDLLRDDIFEQLRRWAYSGQVFALVAGFPCGTFSRARLLPNGPPPIRTNEFLFASQT